MALPADPGGTPTASGGIFSSDYKTMYGPQGYGTYLVNYDVFGNVVGSPTFQGGSQPSGGGGSTNINISNPSASPAAWITITEADGSKWSYNEITGQKIQITAPSNVSNPADKNNDGLDDTTNWALGVYKDPNSWTGYSYGAGIAVWPNGAAAGEDPNPDPAPAPKQAGTWTGYGPKGQGTYYLDGPGGTPGTYIGATVAPPKATTPTYSSGGGGSSGGGSYTPPRDYAGEQAAALAAQAQRDAAQNAFEAEQAEANRKFQWELAAAKTEADRAIAEMNYAVQLRRLGLDEKQFGVDAAETFGRLSSSTDPLAFAAFLHAGGGNIMNALGTGADALSPAALLPAARALQAMRGLGSGGTTGGGFSSGGVGGFPSYRTPTTGGGDGTPTPTPAEPPPATPPVVAPPVEAPNAPQNVTNWSLMPPQGPVQVAGPTFEQLNGGPMTFTPEMAAGYNTQMPGTYTGNPGYATQMPAVGSLWNPNGSGWTAQPGTTAPPPPGTPQPAPIDMAGGAGFVSPITNPTGATLYGNESASNYYNNYYNQPPLTNTATIPMYAEGTMLPRYANGSGRRNFNPYYKPDPGLVLRQLGLGEVNPSTAAWLQKPGNLERYIPQQAAAQGVQLPQGWQQQIGAYSASYVVPTRPDRRGSGYVRKPTNNGPTAYQQSLASQANHPYTGTDADGQSGAGNDFMSQFLRDWRAQRRPVAPPNTPSVALANAGPPAGSPYSASDWAQIQSNPQLKAIYEANAAENAAQPAPQAVANAAPQAVFQPSAQPQMRGLGYVNDPVMMVGDAPSQNPTAGGAKPEIISNPTNAPIGVIPAPETRQMMQGLSGGDYQQSRTQRLMQGLSGGLSRFAEGTRNATDWSTYRDPYTTATQPTSDATWSDPDRPATTIEYGNDVVAQPSPATTRPAEPAPSPVPASTTAPSSISDPALTTPPATAPVAPAPPPIGANVPGSGYGVTPLTPGQLGVMPGDIPGMQEVLGLRQGTQVPNLNYFDVAFNDQLPTLQQLYFSGLQGKFGIPQQDAMAEWQKYRMRGLSGGNLALGV